ncbi:MAG: ABC transporter permease [Oscillospiraceae bacterium]|jgi:simple sugar transport system permease protein|nr:ABC transporter permease [Oscillospiraceae bacterium]
MSAIDTFLYLSPMAIGVSMPILAASLGGLFSERSGVVNIGLEGQMLVGAFAASYVSVRLYPAIGAAAFWLSLPVAMAVALLFSALHAVACVSLNANHVISGTAINMLAAAFTVFFSRTVTGSGVIDVRGGIMRYTFPGLSNIPVLGKILFTDTYHTTWLILFLLLASWFMLYKTSFGLGLRSCGENPHAANAAGISVTKYRYVGVLLSGALSGLGGAVYALCFDKGFTGSIYGLGFLALASLIFGRWNPWGILGSTVFFGYASTVANVATVMPAFAKFPTVLLKVFPYVATLLVLVFFSRTSAAPKAAGEAFDKDKH